MSNTAFFQPFGGEKAFNNKTVKIETCLYSYGMLYTTHSNNWIDTKNLRNQWINWKTEYNFKCFKENILLRCRATKKKFFKMLLFIIIINKIAQLEI